MDGNRDADGKGSHWKVAVNGSWKSSMPFASGPEVTELEREAGRRSPAAFAMLVSEGRWRMAPHLQRLDRAILETLDGVDGIRRLLVMMPPRHGKSELCSKFLPAWFLGRYPDRRVMLTSYEGAFAAEWGRKARDVLREHGERVFGVSVARCPAAAAAWEVEGHAGGMQTAGVMGPLTGRGADLLIVDDPVKNAEEAASSTIREKTWEWWTSTAYTRLEPDGAAIVIQTRWHEGDLAGRLLSEMGQHGEQWRVVLLPAIDEVGEALWPERFPLSRLEGIRRTMGSYYWSALYQQRPTPAEGGKFKREWFSIVDQLPAGITTAVRYWDKAGTEGGGDYSVGCLIAKAGNRENATFYVVDVVRGQWSDLKREEEMLHCAAVDAARFKNYAVWLEQEPGSGGSDSARASIRRLAGYAVRADRVTGSKEVRAAPLAAQFEAGNVRLVRGGWNSVFIDELCVFPNGSHDDQVDAAAGAFNRVAIKREFLVGTW